MLESHIASAKILTNRKRLHGAAKLGDELRTCYHELSDRSQIRSISECGCYGRDDFTLRRIISLAVGAVPADMHCTRCLNLHSHFNRASVLRSESIKMSFETPCDPIGIHQCRNWRQRATTETEGTSASSRKEFLKLMTRNRFTLSFTENEWRTTSSDVVHWYSSSFIHELWRTAGASWTMYPSCWSADVRTSDRKLS